MMFSRSLLARFGVQFASKIPRESPAVARMYVFPLNSSTTSNPVPATFCKYRRNHVLDYLPAVGSAACRAPANEFGPLALKAVRQRMIDNGWSRGYINKSIGRIRRCFKWAVENELVRPDMYHGLMGNESFPSARRAKISCGRICYGKTNLTAFRRSTARRNDVAMGTGIGVLCLRSGPSNFNFVDTLKKRPA